jgi:hypothetical protein
LAELAPGVKAAPLRDPMWGHGWPAPWGPGGAALPPGVVVVDPPGVVAVASPGVVAVASPGVVVDPGLDVVVLVVAVVGIVVAALLEAAFITVAPNAPPANVPTTSAAVTPRRMIVI